ncbi:MAG: hypothetical protein C0595_02570 [Marinilabiliales bacterium]|nr:MAG: hypothetical protein C0595_02570 [Marinilabiliales bacterium]
MSDNLNDHNAKAKLLYEKIYNLWSHVGINDDGEEYRYPNSRSEVKKSKKILKKIHKLDVDDDYVIEWIEYIEETVKTADTKYPKYKDNIITALVFCLLSIVGIGILVSINTYKYPEIKYNPEWFVTTKSTDLLWNTVENKEDDVDIKTKVRIPKGSKLKPIALLNNKWFQVETSDGQRGFVPFEFLKGSDKVKAKKTVWTFKKIGGDRIDTIQAGTLAKVISRKTEKLRYKTESFLKVKLDDGRTRWVVEKNFNTLIFDSIPELNPEYNFETTNKAIHKNIIGDSLEGIEKKYGPATSYFKTKNNYQAYFKHLYVYSGKNKYRGLIVNINENNVADSSRLLHRTGRNFYAKLPLVSQLRGLEITKAFNYQFYLDNIPKMQWWEDFKAYSGWFTRLIAWAIKVGLFGLFLLLFYSMGRLIAGPFMQFFSYTRFLGNSSVKFVNFMIILIITYLLYLYIVLVADQWFFIGILAVGVAYYWYGMHSYTLTMDRCPSCHTIYSAIDMGTTEDGTSKSTSTQKVDEYVGTSVSYSGSTRVNQRNYIRWNKRTTDVYRNYTRNRMCKTCYHEWGVQMAEKIGSSTSYD